MLGFIKYLPYLFIPYIHTFIYMFVRQRIRESISGRVGADLYRKPYCGYGTAKHSIWKKRGKRGKQKVIGFFACNSSAQRRKSHVKGKTRDAIH